MPAGEFAECKSADGAYDLTGNVWEWTGQTDPKDSGARFYQGAGWKIVAQRHTEDEQRCVTQTKLNGQLAPGFRSNTVGFRCCQDAQ